MTPIPDIIDLFPHLRERETHELQARRQELKASSPDGSSLSDDVLQELVCISRILRTRASTSTRPKLEGESPRRKAAAPTLDML